MESFDQLAREFADRGVVKIEGMLDAGKAHAARAMIEELAREHGVLTASRWMKSASRFGYPKPFRSALNALTKSERFPDLVGAPMAALAERLVGAPVTVLAPGQQLLFTLPGEGSWSVPSDVWHIDIGRPGDGASPGLQAFALLGDVAPRGGGTLVVAGSHRLHNHSGELSSKQLKQALGREPWFRALFDPGRAPIERLDAAKGRAEDVELEIVELTGRAGDVYLMDLSVLHTPAPNASDTARMMLTCRFPRSTIAARYGQPMA